MLSDAIIKYNQAKFEIINKFSSSNVNVFEECLCIDKGYLKSKFEDFQKEYKRLSDEIQNLYKYGEKDDYNTKKIKYYIDCKNKLALETSYLISNDINNIDLSKKLIEGINTNLELALEGISAYSKGDIYNSERYLRKYYNTLDRLPNHYLINKIYSYILFDNENYDLSLELMRIAVGKVPEDIELHKKLANIYMIKSDDISWKIEKQIIELLEV